MLFVNSFVNLSGGRDRNLEGDYVMELLVRTAKKRIKRLGPNHKPSTVNKIGQTGNFCHDVGRSMEKQVGVACISRSHTVTDNSKDFEKILDCLRKADVFKIIADRQYQHYKVESTNFLEKVNVKKLHAFLKEKKKIYSSGKFAF